ncbi:SpoIIE family protein phosphatase [Streptomyces sp. RPT161]|uniref:SpoIIE family protein phosphatase n=1 Tax=Streptomyces sp. RPT161 TaxID=3015993 RepID=UPI0022B89280|nr:SpoIIE family protein phosphatase [Streptomyces sp. RPT161]
MTNHRQNVGSTPDAAASGEPSTDTSLAGDGLGRYGLEPVDGEDDPTSGSSANVSASPADVGRLAATVARLREQVRQAQADADGRALLEMAKGVLMERLRLSPVEAARQLVELAQAAGISQLQLAADIVNQAARDQFTDAARDFLDRVASEDRPAADAEAGESLAVQLRTAESGVLAASDAQAVACSLLEHALTPLGATAVAIWTNDQGGALRLAGYAGFPEQEALRWHYVPPGVSTPARRALAAREAVWFEELAATGLPSVAHQLMPRGGRVAVPAEAQGRIQGVLEICWPGAPIPQQPAVRRQIEALAELAAHTLETLPAAAETDHVTAAAGCGTQLAELADSLLDAALVLRAELDTDGRLLDFRILHANPRFTDPAGRPRSAVTGALLLEAYPLAAEEHGLFDKVAHVHATGEPFSTAGMAFTAVVGQVQVPTTIDVSIIRHGQEVLLIWRFADEAARLAHLLQHAQRLVRIGGFEEDHTTGRIMWSDQLYALYGLPLTAPALPLEQLADLAHPDDTAAISRFLRTVLHHRRPGAVALRLQRLDGIVRHIRVVAEPVLDIDHRLVGVRGAYQDISAQHWTEVALAATRDQLAYSEQQTAERNRLAKQLQQAIMPPAHGPIDAPDLEIAVRYRPAEDDSLVGGDWYDATMLPTKQLLLSIGDVAGHGIEAATGMVALRNALRGLATTGAGPAQLLTWLNLVAHHLTEQVTATAICALFDPETRMLKWARAGHMPPVLIRGEGATTVPLVQGLLLGAISETTYEEGEIQLQHDDVLLLYTDGLIERRDRSLQESLDQLLATAASRAGGTLDQRLDHLLTHSSSDTDDDTCVIGVRLSSLSGQPPA